MSSTPESPLPFGRREIEEKLGKFDAFERKGKGSYGVTFRISRNGTIRALKVIHVLGLPEFRWDRELSALRAIDHPNVVRYIDAGEFTIAGTPYRYLETEFVSAGDLGTRIEANARPVNPKEVRDFAQGLLRGLQGMHAKGVTHRDIKPQNICMRNASWENPVIVDLGLARLDAMSTHTMYPQPVGTFPYMAPEQLRGERAKRRSDLFAVGAVLYHVVTGQHPFLSTPCSLPELMARIRNGPATPDTLSPAFDKLASEAVVRMLSFRESDRLSVERALQDMIGA